MKLQKYHGNKVVTLETINEYIIDENFKAKCKNNLYKWIDKTNSTLLPMQEAREYGQKKKFNYSRGLWVFEVRAVMDCFVEHINYFEGKIDTEAFADDVAKGEMRSANEPIKISNTPKKKEKKEITPEISNQIDIPMNQINMPFDEVYALVDRIGEHTAIVIQSLGEKIEYLSNQVEELNEKIVHLEQQKYEAISNSVLEPIILKENATYEEWSKSIKKALKLILTLCPDKKESDILHEAYERLRSQYTIVWEQEAKEFRDEYERSPVNTRELCWWIENTKPNYKNLLIGKLNTIYSELRRSVKEANCETSE